MATLDIRLPEDFLDHRKTIKLIRRIGLEGLFCLLRLWFYAAKRRTNGVLHGMSNEDIAIEARWTNEPDDFVGALEEVGFVGRMDDGTPILHEWAEHQPWIVGAEARSAGASKAAHVKHEKRRASEADAERMRAAEKGDRKTSGTHAPSLTLPIPFPEPDPSSPAHVRDGEDASPLEQGLVDHVPKRIERDIEKPDPVEETGIFEGFSRLEARFLRYFTKGGACLPRYAREEMKQGMRNLELTCESAIALFDRYDDECRKRGKTPARVDSWAYFQTVFQNYLLADAREPPTPRRQSAYTVPPKARI